MGLEPVLREVEARGEREAAEILGRARTEADGLLNRARAEARALAEAAEAEARQEAERMRRAQIPAAELEAKRGLLQVEREVLGAVLARARERLAALAPEKNREYLSLLARRALRDGGQKLCANGRDLPALRGMGHPVAREISCAGGVAAETGDGSVWLDYTYDTLLEAAWRGSQREVRQTLFPTSKPAGPEAR